MERQNGRFESVSTTGAESIPFSKRLASISTFNTILDTSKHNNNLRNFIANNYEGFSQLASSRGRFDTVDENPLSQETGRNLSENTVLSKTNEELRVILRELQNQLRNALDELEAVSRLENQTSQKNELQFEIDQIKARFEELEQKNHRLLAEITQIERNFSVVQSQSSSAITYLQNERDRESAEQSQKFTSEVLALREAQIDSEARLESIRLTIQSLEQQLSRLLSELKQVLIEQGEKKELEAKARAENTSLRLSLDSIGSANLQKMTGVTAEEMQLRETINRLQKELSLKQIQVSSMERNLPVEVLTSTSLIRYEIESLKAQNAQLQTEIQRNQKIIPVQVPQVQTTQIIKEPQLTQYSQSIQTPNNQSFGLEDSQNLSQLKLATMVQPSQYQFTTLQREPYNSLMSSNSDINTPSGIDRLRLENDSLRSDLVHRIEANEENTKTLSGLIRSAVSGRHI